MDEVTKIGKKNTENGSGNTFWRQTRFFISHAVNLYGDI